MNRSFFHRLTNLVRTKPRLVLFLGSLVISTSFFTLKQEAVKLLGISIKKEMGHVNDEGLYVLGDYTKQVNHLIRTGKMTSEGKVLNRYPPGYPFLLYAVYLLTGLLHLKFQYGLFILAALFIGISTVLIGEIAHLFFKERILAVGAGLLYATHPYILQGLSKVMSVTPFMAFLYGSLLVFFLFIVQKRSSLWYPVLVGGLLGIAMLIRPIGLFLPIVMAGLSLFFLRHSGWQKSLLVAGAILASSVVTIAPWQIFNYSHGQQILLSSDEVTSMLDGVSFNNDPVKNPINLPADVDSLARFLSRSEVSSRGEFLQLGLQELSQRPVPMIKLIVIKAARSWYGAFDQEKKSERVKLLILLVYLSLAFWGISKIKLKANNWYLFGLTTLVLVFYFWALTMLVVSMVRYMYPVFGLLVVFIPALFQKRVRQWGTNSPS